MTLQNNHKKLVMILAKLNILSYQKLQLFSSNKSYNISTLFSLIKQIKKKQYVSLQEIALINKKFEDFLTKL